MEMADISVKNENEDYQYQKKSRCNLCLHINVLLIVFGLTIVSLYSYMKIIELKEKIQQLDTELRTRLELLELIPNMRETIGRLATEDNLTRKMAETNSKLTNRNRESQLEAQEKIRRLDAELQNMFNWSRTRLEQIPSIQEENMQMLDRQRAHLFLITVFEQLKIRIYNSAFNQTSCLEGVSEKIIAVRPCQYNLNSQLWLWTKTGEIRYGKRCLNYDGTDLTLYWCHKFQGNQLWKYDYKEHSIEHGYHSKKCLSVSDSKNELLMETCDRNIETQRWDFETPWVY